MRIRTLRNARAASLLFFAASVAWLAAFSASHQASYVGLFAAFFALGIAYARRARRS